MTLNELCRTTGNVCLLTIDVRDAQGKLIESYHIGSQATEDRVKDEHLEPRWKCIKEPINHKERDRDYWGFCPDAIPRALLNMEVMRWSYFGDYKTNNGLSHHMHLMVHLLGEDHCIETKAEEKTNMIGGQMTIQSILDGYVYG